MGNAVDIVGFQAFSLTGRCVTLNPGVTPRPRSLGQGAADYAAAAVQSGTLHAWVEVPEFDTSTKKTQPLLPLTEGLSEERERRAEGRRQVIGSPRALKVVVVKRWRR